jgi:hypothetical protein
MVAFQEQFQFADAPQPQVVTEDFANRVCFGSVAFHRPSGEATIVIAIGEYAPAFMLLTVDKGPAGFTLRFKRVEGLLKPFFRRLSGVNGTPNVSFRHRDDLELT